MPNWLTVGLQDGASLIMEQLILFHDHTLMIMLMILTTVTYMMVMLMKKNISRFMLEGQLIETTWAITPAIILVFIAMPSLRLLKLMDEVHMPALTLKVVGHQWYWSYEYSDFTKLEFDWYMTQNED